MKISGFFTSLLLLVGATCAFSQDEPVVHPDSVKGKFLPTGIRVGTGVINMIRTSANSDLTELTFIADIDFYRYFWNVEWGRFEITRADGTNALYSVEGSYFRFGPEINFLKKDPEKNALFFGLRYARASFDDKLTYTSASGFFDNDPLEVSNNGLAADWYEMVTGLKVKIWKNLWMGYTARFKFGVDTFERNELIPHDIPGYGRADQRSAWDFNYWIMFRIPIRKPQQSVLDAIKSTD